MATLYRKYRSQRFEEVIGQDAIVTTLTNQIKCGRIGHAYLFTGSRGIGKTSCARIFARAVNCLNPVNGSPCGECEVCKKLAADNVDIIELDAASNNGVDDARDIREKVKYLPVACKYKVYIIDEAHMLTGGAFNALLKTIEEPPEHVIFILATTEPQKLPQTILSRCIRFDFKLVATDVLAEHVARIYDAEGIKYTREAAEEIARLGEGSVRDALSVADTLGAAADVITPEVVFRLTGSGDAERIAELFESAADKNLPAVLTAIDGFARDGKSMAAVCRQLIDYTRNVLVAKSVGAENAKNGIINASRTALERIIRSAGKFDISDISRILEQTSAAESGLKYSVNPRVYLETALVKLVCDARRDEDMLKRIEALEKNSATQAEQKKNELIVCSATAQPTAPAPLPESTDPRPKKSKADVEEPAPPPSEEPDYSEYVPPPPPESERVEPEPIPAAPVRVDAAMQKRKVSEIKLSSADEGEFHHRSASTEHGLELLGKISSVLRKAATPAASALRSLLARGVIVKERADAVAFIAPDDVTLLLGEEYMRATLDAALIGMGINKPARPERTAEALYQDDLQRACELFGSDGVISKAGIKY